MVRCDKVTAASAGKTRAQEKEESTKGSKGKGKGKVKSDNKGIDEGGDKGPGSNGGKAEEWEIEVLDTGEFR